MQAVPGMNDCSWWDLPNARMASLSAAAADSLQAWQCRSIAVALFHKGRQVVGWQSNQNKSRRRENRRRQSRFRIRIHGHRVHPSDVAARSAGELVRGADLRVLDAGGMCRGARAPVARVAPLALPTREVHEVRDGHGRVVRQQANGERALGRVELGGGRHGSAESTGYTAARCGGQASATTLGANWARAMRPPCTARSTVRLSLVCTAILSFFLRPCVALADSIAWCYHL